MKKYIFLCLLSLLVIVQGASGQAAVARLKFEDAEEAYNKGDYATTLSKLEDAEKLFGKINLPILHLRILAQDKLLQKNLEFGLLTSLRNNCNQFLKDYENVEGIEDKYRQVYKVLEANAKHPATAAEYEKIVAQKKAEEQRKKTEAEFKKLVFISIFRNTDRSSASKNFAFFINGKYVSSLENDTYLAFHIPSGTYQFAFQLEDTQNPQAKTLALSTKQYPVFISNGLPAEFKLDVEGRKGDEISVIPVKEKEKSRLYKDCKLKAIAIFNIQPM